MTIMYPTQSPTTTTTPTGVASPRSQATRSRITRLLAPLLVAAGATTVIIGSYMAWATFYAGLVSRNGVPGDGKYFIGLAAASVVAMLLATRPRVWRALRYASVPAAAIIAFMAVRDLRNLNALVHDPAAGLYVPGRGDGLFVVFAGAVILALAAVVPFSSQLAATADDEGLEDERNRPSRAPSVLRSRTLAALLATIGTAVLVPGMYGEYYLHVANGHVHGHTDVFNTPHLLTVGGITLLLAAAQLAIMSLRRSRTRARSR